MENDKHERHSCCIVCNVRLSTRMPSGAIHWESGYVDDNGLFCRECYKQQMKAPKKKSSAKKKAKKKTKKKTKKSVRRSGR
jgi:hypothetical protein